MLGLRRVNSKFGDGFSICEPCEAFDGTNLEETKNKITEIDSHHLLYYVSSQLTVT